MDGHSANSGILDCRGLKIYDKLSSNLIEKKIYDNPKLEINGMGWMTTKEWPYLTEDIRPSRWGDPGSMD